MAQLHVHMSSPLAPSLPLSLCLSPTLSPSLFLLLLPPSSPPSGCFFFFFVDCSPAVVIVTVMQTARTGCLSAWICQVCVSDKTPECSRLREEVFGELCNVLFFFFLKKGGKVNKTKGEKLLSVHLYVSFSGYLCVRPCLKRCRMQFSGCIG